MRPNVLVPTHDRRQRRRIVTLKNFGWLFVALVVVLVALSFDLFSWRGAEPGQYGRLVQKEIVRSDAVKARPQVVTEAPVSDQTAADPLLIAPAAREQEFLSTTEQRRVPVVPPVVAPVVAPAVVIVRKGEAAKQPVLAGGIFRQAEVPASGPP